MPNSTATPLADVAPPINTELAVLKERLRRTEHIIAALEKGVALLDPQLRILWTNQPFRKWCPEPPEGKPFPEALGKFHLLRSETLPLAIALAGRTISARILHHDTHYLDVTITPFREGTEINDLVVLCTDVTAAVERQQKLDALHLAAQELVPFDSETLDEMSVEARVELLKQTLRRHIHDLLEYDVIEIRLLNRQTNELEPLLAEGMTQEAATRILYALPEKNGVTGHVAATGKSYLCHDTTNDELYLPGAADARCSMTVPLIAQGQVIGTFNVESPKVNAFTKEDLQFAELFSRDLAGALHTLDLLKAQLSCTAGQAIEAVNREIAMPADELLSLAGVLLKQFADQPQVAEPLQRIMADLRSIKQSVQSVGEELVRTTPKAGAETRLKGRRVLVIDNEERVRRSIHTLLEKQGCQVETASTAQEGLALAGTETYDAVLTAVRHPDMGGTTVYRQLKAMQPAARVILTQGFEYDGGHTVVNARQEGYTYPVLFKHPFQEAQVLAVLTG